MSDCRFDPAHIAGPPISDRGNPKVYGYPCELCGLEHWCVPAAEAEGVAETRPLALLAAFAAAVSAGLLAGGLWSMTPARWQAEVNPPPNSR